MASPNSFGSTGKGCSWPLCQLSVCLLQQERHHGETPTAVVMRQLALEHPRLRFGQSRGSTATTNVFIIRNAANEEKRTALLWPVMMIELMNQEPGVSTRRWWVILVYCAGLAFLKSICILSLSLDTSHFPTSLSRPTPSKTLDLLSESLF